MNGPSITGRKNLGFAGAYAVRPVASRRFPLSFAALYESTSIPVAVLLVVPLGVFGALIGVYLFERHAE